MRLGFEEVLNFKMAMHSLICILLVLFSIAKSCGAEFKEYNFHPELTEVTEFGADLSQIQQSEQRSNELEDILKRFHTFSGERNKHEITEFRADLSRIQQNEQRSNELEDILKRFRTTSGVRNKHGIVGYNIDLSSGEVKQMNNEEIRKDLEDIRHSNQNDVAGFNVDLSNGEIKVMNKEDIKSFNGLDNNEENNEIELSEIGDYYTSTKQSTEMENGIGKILKRYHRIAGTRDDNEILKAIEDSRNVQNEKSKTHVVGYKIDLSNGEMEKMSNEEIKEDLEQIRDTSESDVAAFNIDMTNGKIKELSKEEIKKSLDEFRNLDEETAQTGVSKFSLDSIKGKLKEMTLEDIKKSLDGFRNTNKIDFKSSTEGSYSMSGTETIFIVLFVVAFVISIGLTIRKYATIPRQRIFYLVTSVARKSEESEDNVKLVPAKQIV